MLLFALGLWLEAVAFSWCTSSPGWSSSTQRMETSTGLDFPCLKPQSQGGPDHVRHEGMVDILVRMTIFWAVFLLQGWCWHSPTCWCCQDTTRKISTPTVCPLVSWSAQLQGSSTNSCSALCQWVMLIHFHYWFSVHLTIKHPHGSSEQGSNNWASIIMTRSLQQPLHRQVCSALSIWSRQKQSPASPIRFPQRFAHSGIAPGLVENELFGSIQAPKLWEW